MEVRVLEVGPSRLAKPITTSDVRLDTWVDLPGVTPARRCEVRSGIHLTFDVPEIPPALPDIPIFFVDKPSSIAYIGRYLWQNPQK